MRPMKLFNRLVAGLLVGLVSLSSHALQVVDAIEGKSLAIRIAAKEPSRISVENGKIVKITATEGELMIEKDTDAGQIFVKPLILDKPINLFLKTDTGHTFTVLMQAVDTPAEDIVFRDIQKNTGTASKLERSGSYQKIIRSFVLSMANGETADGIEIKSINQEYALWKDVKFILTKSYTGKQIVGEKFRLTNVGQQQVRLAEQEFYKKGVIAIAIENLTLDPGQATNIYVLRNEEGVN